MTVPDATKRFLAAASELGIEPDIHVFPDGTKTSQDAADAVGCDLSQIAKSLVFMVDDRPVLCLMSGDRRVDLKRLAGAVGGAEGRRASLEEARSATGFAAGGTPAFGHTSELEVVADINLQRNEDLWSAAGTPTTVYPITRQALIEASGARWVDVAEA